MDTKTYLSLLFDDFETIASSKAPYRKCMFSTIADIPADVTHIAVNPFVFSATRRLRKYVQEYRNFLIEFDNIPTEKQLQLVHDSGLPFTTAVFSGNKSVHFIIALYSPVSKEKYSEIANKLKKIFPQADKACLEPTRLTRLAMSGQPLITNRDKVTIDELTSWLDENYKASKEKKIIKPVSMGVTRITKKTRDFLDGKSLRSTAHADSIHATKNLLEAGISPKIIVSMLANVRKLTTSEYDHTSAIEKAEQLVNWVVEQWHTKEAGHEIN